MTFARLRNVAARIWTWTTDGPQQSGFPYMLALLFWWRMWAWYVLIGVVFLTIYRLTGVPTLGLDWRVAVYAVAWLGLNWVGDWFMNPDVDE